MPHRRLIADCSVRIGKPGVYVFIYAKISQNEGYNSPTMVKQAEEDFRRFLVTGRAPEYVENYALDKLRRPKATKKNKEVFHA